MSVRLEREGTTAWIRWSRPERLNAWDRASLVAIGEALAEAGGSDARAIVCFGEGGAWSAGDDLRETATLTPQEWAKAIEGFNQLTRAAVAAPQPVIAAIDGVCVGGAFEFAFACDVRLASSRSRFGCPEVAIGLSISNGFSLLAPRAARRLVLTGELVAGEEAYRLGLVDVLAEDVEGEARTLAERIGRLGSARRRRVEAAPRRGGRARPSSRRSSGRLSSARSSSRRPTRARARSLPGEREAALHGGLATPSGRPGPIRTEGRRILTVRPTAKHEHVFAMLADAPRTLRPPVHRYFSPGGRLSWRSRASSRGPAGRARPRRSRMPSSG